MVRQRVGKALAINAGSLTVFAISASLLTPRAAGPGVSAAVTRSMLTAGTLYAWDLRPVLQVARFGRQVLLGAAASGKNKVIQNTDLTRRGEAAFARNGLPMAWQAISDAKGAGLEFALGSAPLQAQWIYLSSLPASTRGEHWTNVFAGSWRPALDCRPR